MIPVVGFVLRRRIHPRLHLRSQARLRLVGGKGRGGRGLFAVSADEKRLKSTWVGKDVWVRLVEGSGRTSANPCSRRNSSTPWSCDARGGAAGDAMLAAGGVRGDGSGRKESSHDVVVRLRPRPANPELPKCRPISRELKNYPVFINGGGPYPLLLWPLPNTSIVNQLRRVLVRANSHLARVV